MPPSDAVNPGAREAYRNAVYAHTTMDFNYDADSGLFTASVDGTEAGSRVTIVGSPGEIIADRRFYVPRVQSIPERVGLAFEIGYLLGKQELERQ